MGHITFIVCFVNTYPLDNDLSGGLQYTVFEQLRPEKLSMDWCTILIVRALDSRLRCPG